jgi:hypothetical protein
MTANLAELKGIALAAVKQAYSASDEDNEVTIFVSHHLEEISSDYWKDQLGTAKPDPAQVLDILELESSWEDGDSGELHVFDFTLPNEVTNYLLSVRLNATGRVDEISMES